MLLKSIDEVRAVVRVGKALEFDRISAHLAQAEMSFIAPALGSDMYAMLIAYHNNPETYKITADIQDNNFLIGATSGDLDDNNLNPEEKAWSMLLYYTQKSIANIALWIGFDQLNVSTSDAGFKRSESEQVKSLFKYQEDNLKKYFRNSGIDGIDVILEILETRIQYFDAYKTEMYRHKGRIIADTKTFQVHYHINNSRIVFDRLRQYMKTVEELELSKYIRESTLAYIFEELKKENPADKVKAIMPYLRDPVAYLSTAMLMEDSGAELTERGLYLKGIKNLTNSDLEINTDEARVKDLIERNKRIAQEYFIRLKKYLADNAASWAEDANPRSNALHNRDNSGKRTFFT
jgi:hypothetical protein